jgi:hypothetical protein
MSAGGWITLVLSVGFVVTLFSWTMWRVARGPRDDGAHRGTLAHVEPVEEELADQR